MATQFQEVFGDMLITAPLDKTEQTLPSPEKLKRKILLKHKKLPDGADEILGIGRYSTIKFNIFGLILA